MVRHEAIGADCGQRFFTGHVKDFTERSFSEIAPMNGRPSVCDIQKAGEPFVIGFRFKHRSLLDPATVAVIPLTRRKYVLSCHHIHHPTMARVPLANLLARIWLGATMPAWPYVSNDLKDISLIDRD